MRKPGKTVLDDVCGLILIGAGLFLFLALISYDPRDVPKRAFFSVTSEENPSIENLIGPSGALVAGFVYFLFGAAAYLIAVLLLGFGMAKIARPKFLLRERAGWGVLLVLCGASLLHLQPWFLLGWKDQFAVEGPGGWFGLWLGEKAFQRAFNLAGAGIVLSLLYLLSLILVTGFHPVQFLRECFRSVRNWVDRRRKRRADRRKRRLEQLDEQERFEVTQRELNKRTEELEKRLRKNRPPKVLSFPAESGEDFSQIPEPKIIDTTVPLPSKKPTLDELRIKKPWESAAKASSLSDVHFENYSLPTLDLLDPHDTAALQPADPAELRATQDVIIDTLAQFGIQAKPGDITKGPTITRFEIYPGKAVRVDRITSLERDIARATCAERINILAPIPGKDTVGVEIANAKKVKVTLRELFETEEWLNTKAKLPLALGKDVYGNTLIADLAQMPHGLVAGTTGSGKSVCINAIIASLLFRFTPEDLRFIMIDPKVVEMQIYNTLPHLVTPVVTDPKKVLLALRWVIDEMANRYRIFAKTGVRNIHGFNSRPKPKSQAELDAEDEVAEESERDEPADVLGDPEDVAGGSETPVPRIQVPRDDDLIIPEHMAYIVIIIDELADLMQTAPADVESAIARITQMARAAGIHMIVATQTPRADVVTGIIKANIPSRIAFQVASKIDSRVILDENGAEKLLGQGDMLYLPPGTSKLVRSQGVLVTDDEIRRLVEFVSSTAQPRFDPQMSEKLATPSSGDEEIDPEDEELVEKCLEIIKQERKASTSMLQRRLRLGYTRAARVVDILEARGILGPKDGAKDREILVDLDSLP